MIHPDSSPVGSIVRLDKRTHEYKEADWLSRVRGKPAREWGFIVEWFPPDDGIGTHRCRVLWNTGAARIENAWPLCKHNQLERQRSLLDGEKS